MISPKRAVGWSLIFLGGGFGLTLFLLWAISPLLPAAGPFWLPATSGLVMVLVFGLATWLCGGLGLGLRAADLGLLPVGPGVRGFGWGFLLGAVLGVVAMAAAVPLGHAAWRGDGGSIRSWGVTVLATGLVLFPAALAEEVIFRGVPMVALSRAFGRVPVIVALAALFAVGHFLNPGITLLATANIALAGVFLGVAFFAPGGLWTSTGAHLGWNLTIVSLAAPVSGVPLPMPWLDYDPGAPDWLTGGSFGPEGGILGALVFLGGALVAKRRMRSEASA